MFVTGEAEAGALVTGLPSRFSSPSLLFVSFCPCVLFYLGLLAVSLSPLLSVNQAGFPGTK